MQSALCSCKWHVLLHISKFQAGDANGTRTSTSDVCIAGYEDVFSAESEELSQAKQNGQMQRNLNKAEEEDAGRCLHYCAH